MSAANRDYSSPYAVSPHQNNGAKKIATRQTLKAWTMRDMGDSLDSKKVVEAQTLTDALKIYAATKWNHNAAFLLPIYVKIEGESKVRCVHPQGQIEIMNW